MSIVVWSERQTGKWTDCVFSAYGMALEAGGFSAFPLGANTAAEREAFAGPNANKASGTTLKEADALAKARYGIALKPLDVSIPNALKRPGYALVITGNYSRLSGNSALVKDIYAWNKSYNDNNPLPSVDHAVTVITNADGTLTWLDPTAKQGSAGVPVSAEEVIKFAGPSLKEYPARMIKIGELAPSNEQRGFGYDVYFHSLSSMLGVFTWNDIYKFSEIANSGKGDKWTSIVDGLRGDTPKDTLLTASDIDKIALAEQNNGGEIWGGQDPVSATIGALSSIVGILGKFTNPANWLHLGAMLAGVAVIGFGLYLASKDLSQSGPEGMVSPMPIILKEGA